MVSTYTHCLLLFLFVHKVWCQCPSQLYHHRTRHCRICGCHKVLSINRVEQLRIIMRCYHKAVLSLGIQGGDDVREVLFPKGSFCIEFIQGHCPVEILKLFLYELQKNNMTDQHQSYTCSYTVIIKIINFIFKSVRVSSFTALN